MNKLLGFVIFIFATNAYAKDIGVVVSVGNMTELNSTDFQKKTCDQVYAIAHTVSESKTNVTCRTHDQNNFSDTELQAQKNTNDYHLRIILLAKNRLSLEITQWSRINNSDFKTLSQNFTDSPDSRITKEMALSRSIYNFILYAHNSEKIKTTFLMYGLEESNSIARDEKTDSFIDKKTGDPISISQAVARFETEAPSHLNYMRAGVEIAAQLAVGAIFYYKNISTNKLDFDYELLNGLKAKYITGKGIRFDDNDRLTNYLHEYAGYIYYQTARSNGASPLASFLIAFAGSAAWETFEYHEVFSINDQIMTPVGGYVTGEAFYQVSCSLLKNNNISSSAVGYILSPMLAVNHAIDKSKYGSRYATDSDCAKSRWSDINFYMGYENAQKSWKPSTLSTGFIGLKAEVINVPLYGKNGEGKGLIYGSPLNKILLEASNHGNRMDLKIIAQTAMTAYYSRIVTNDQDGKAMGYDFVAGIGSASTWNHRDALKKIVANDEIDSSKQLVPSDEDYFGTINILGPLVHLTTYYKGWRIRAEFAIYGDFALVKSYAIDQFIAQEGDDGLPAEIAKRGYYFGKGYTIMDSLSAEYGRLRISYSGQYSSESVIHGYSRNKKLVTRKDEFRDVYQTNRITLNLRLSKKISFELAEEQLLRSGSINGNYNKSENELRSMGALVYRFH
ncbi:MAG: hypothetical protein A2Z20_09475 [Bdellovibrionales bacterium RBG_16_40_8]|nr:MAG: hypothetical protein A2Z20_09475 [Bdellovibrionales bacterium RBG_16_40_8]